MVVFFLECNLMCDIFWIGWEFFDGRFCLFLVLGGMEEVLFDNCGLLCDCCWGLLGYLIKI